MSATALSASQAIIDLFDDYVIPNYRRQPIALVRGEGSRVWDADGRCYLDLFPGWGCNILGYSPPRLVKAIQEQAARLIHVPNTWYIEQQGRFAQFLCSRGFGKAFFCNSGAEANEAAIKLCGCTVLRRTGIESSRLKTGFMDAPSGRSRPQLSPSTMKGSDRSWRVSATPK